MYDKETTFSIINTDVLSDELLKTAAVNDLPEKYDPDFLYVWVRAVSAGEYWSSNKNADFFSEKELVDHYPTFMDAHVFKNHANKDVADAIGSVLVAKWNDKMKCVELLIKIDRHLAPTIARGFEKGYSTDVSMGCRVSHTVCSYCGNIAKTRQDFCTHVKTMRNQVMADGKKVFEFNVGPKFHDISIVLNGADRTAKLLEIVASEDDQSFEKAASVLEVPEFIETDIDGKLASDMLANQIRFSKTASEIRKVADIQKEIIDKLYLLSILNRTESTPEEVDDLVDLAKHAGEAYGINKNATAVKDVRNIALGSLGIALATNYFQGKRLRGEKTNAAENFVADNPGVLPIAYAVGAYPALKKLKAATAKEVASKIADEDYSYIFSKEAANLGEYTVSNGINIFSDENVANILKTSYDIDEMKQHQVKLALAAYGMGREDLVTLIKSANSLTDSDINNFLKVSMEVINGHIEKEANIARSTLEASLINSGNTKHIPTGLGAPVYALSLVDGLIFHKLFAEGEDAKSKKVNN